MGPEEFIKAAALSGYASKKRARAYAKEKKKEAYTDEDFMELHQGSMRWEGCATAFDHKARRALKMNGRTTAFGNGIAGNSGAGQDWKF